MLRYLHIRRGTMTQKRAFDIHGSLLRLSVEHGLRGEGDLSFSGMLPQHSVGRFLNTLLYSEVCKSHHYSAFPEKILMFLLYTVVPIGRKTGRQILVDSMTENSLPLPGSLGLRPVLGFLSRFYPVGVSCRCLELSRFAPFGRSVKGGVQCRI